MSLILIVDDVEAMREQYAYDLARLTGHETRAADGGAAALQALEREDVDCVILDLEMPGVDGFEVLRTMQARGLRVPVIVYTGTGDYDRCVRAVKLGAYGFIDKEEPTERVAREVENALEQGRLRREVDDLRRKAGEATPLVGGGAAMRALRAGIEKLAPVPSPVLVTGESGSGKELVARELHRLSGRAKGPFKAVNCAALPDTLVESELFGHERGAFTGAERTRKGAFELAKGGTLFLDEVGELPAAAQAKLLRVLEERTITRLGGDRELPVDCRVLAATNRDLDAEAAAGRFREDLLFRLNVHGLRVPPLRERPEDLPELVAHFLADTARRYGRREQRASAAALERLAAYDWRRNNVRELRNIVERMVISSEGEEIGPECVPGELLRAPGAAPGSVAPPGAAGAAGDAGAAAGGAGGAAAADGATDATGGGLKEKREAAERRIVLEALERHRWQMTRTARELGLADHASLAKVMRRLGIERPRD